MPDVAKLTDQYDDLPLECDGLTRVLHTVLARHGVRHDVMTGYVKVLGTEDPKTGKSTGIPLHYWIQLADGRLMDYRARMWLDDSAPHGVFWQDRHKKYKYIGKRDRMPVMSDALFAILTGGRKIMARVAERYLRRI